MPICFHCPVLLQQEQPECRLFFSYLNIVFFPGDESDVRPLRRNIAERNLRFLFLLQLIDNNDKTGRWNVESSGETSNEVFHWEKLCFTSPLHHQPDPLPHSLTLTHAYAPLHTPTHTCVHTPTCMYSNTTGEKHTHSSIPICNSWAASH